MSDHSKPRRWTLAIPAASRRRELIPRVLQLTSVLFSDEERVPVREDCITTEDVEAVAKWIREREFEGDAPSLAEEYYKTQAADALARIFEGGER